MLKTTKENYDKVIRELIKSETDYVNSRMNWLILLQGLLFTGFYHIFQYCLPLACAISILGILISLIMKRSFWSNEKAIAFILKKWDKFISDNGFEYDDFPPVWAGAYNEIISSKKDKFLEKELHFFTAHKAMPNIFIFIWLFNLTFCAIRIIFG